jgi:hypothetical protein
VLTAGALNQAKFALGGLIVDEKQMARNLERPGSGGRPERLKRGQRGDPDTGLAARVPSEAAWGPAEFSRLQVGRAR